MNDVRYIWTAGRLGVVLDRFSRSVGVALNRLSQPLEERGLSRSPWTEESNRQRRFEIFRGEQRRKDLDIRPDRQRIVVLPLGIEADDRLRFVAVEIDGPAAGLRVHESEKFPPCVLRFFVSDGMVEQ